MKAHLIELGRKVRCQITGAVGIAVARTISLNGCERITVQPLVGKDGKYPDAVWIDDFALEYVGKDKITVTEQHDRGGLSVMKKHETPPRA